MRNKTTPDPLPEDPQTADTNTPEIETQDQITEMTTTTTGADRRDRRRDEEDSHIATVIMRDTGHRDIVGAEVAAEGDNTLVKRAGRL